MSFYFYITNWTNLSGHLIYLKKVKNVPSSRWWKRHTDSRCWRYEKQKCAENIFFFSSRLSSEMIIMENKNVDQLWTIWSEVFLLPFVTLKIVLHYKVRVIWTGWFGRKARAELNDRSRRKSSKILDLNRTNLNTLRRLRSLKRMCNRICS